MVQIKGKIYHSVRETATRMGLAINTVRGNWQKWGLEPYRYGSRLFFEQENIDKHIESRMQPGRPYNAAIGTVIGV